MNRKNVLAVGLHPASVDFTAIPQFTPEMFRSYIDAQLDRLRDAGFDVVSCLIDTGETAEAVLATALKAQPFDCVVIGAGLRLPPERLSLFEKVLNLVHT